uniref:Uncharacterized protein n=1 Tax=Arundo donax TaxID=35708 RepID=A0A0A9FIZ2_ARUDO
MSTRRYSACPTQSASVFYMQSCKQRNWLFGV